ncbi:MAG TPA: hypothetical protein DD723_01420 [Candidatus Omnitrophica bacterium]|nr:MAG: hypothetical protein A2Z81_02005 [Omnitrophica WOR_2 bacterium GWA2_45_18]HBR14191.1 hypothetical protein [Candidatus Omnitrophota bacterium]
MDMHTAHTIDLVLMAYAALCQIALILIVLVTYVWFPRNSEIISAEELKKLKEEITRYQMQPARLEEEMQRFKAESAKVKGEDLLLKEKEIQRLTAELKRVNDTHQEITQKQIQSARLEEEMQRFKAESAKVKGEDLLLKEKEIQRLTAELKRVNDTHQDYEKHIAKLKEVTPDIDAMEVSLNEEKKALHEIKLRAQEGKMKLALLNEKTKDAVESIAQFAQGKEFDEFRKSIHLDEIVQKYEGEIKDLKIENMELEKKLGRTV